jgi:8-oxo-dGTP diphosphatase
MDPQGRVLISKRHADTHQGGLWEFPGGKLEPGESPLAALQRELTEELGIVLLQAEPLIGISHDYPDRRIRLDVFRVLEYSGQPRGMEGQPLAWRLPQAMQTDEFPAADRPIITALQLPDRYLITGENPQRPEVFLQHLALALERGLTLVQLRAHTLADKEYNLLARVAWDICRDHGARMLLSRPDQPQTWADGVHLTRHQLMAMSTRPGGAGLVGASCHDPRELAQAQRLGLDYALLSPVQPTASHPGRPAIGWDRFRAWVESLNLPVYALGGVGGDSLAQAKLCGAQGIAAIRSFWGSQPPKP